MQAQEALLIYAIIVLVMWKLIFPTSKDKDAPTTMTKPRMNKVTCKHCKKSWNNNQEYSNREDCNEPLCMLMPNPKPPSLDKMTPRLQHDPACMCNYCCDSRIKPHIVKEDLQIANKPRQVKIKVIRSEVMVQGKAPVNRDIAQVYTFAPKILVTKIQPMGHRP